MSFFILKKSITFYFLSKTLIPSVQLKKIPTNTSYFNAFLNCVYIFIPLLEVYTSFPIVLNEFYFCSFVSHGLVHNTETNNYMKDLT